MLNVMVANICSLNVQGPGLSECRTPKRVIPQSGSTHSRNLAQGYSRIWITDPLRPFRFSQRDIQCQPSTVLFNILPMPGNLLLKKVDMKVPMTAHEMPKKYARTVSIGT